VGLGPDPANVGLALGFGAVPLGETDGAGNGVVARLGGRVTP